MSFEQFWIGIVTCTIVGIVGCVTGLALVILVKILYLGTKAVFGGK